MARRTRRTIPAHLAIAEAAYHLFLTQGYHGTSVRQVARQAGLSPAAIYNYYPSKEALFLALLSQNLPHRTMIRALASVEGDDAETLVREGLRRMASAMANQFDNLRLMFIELLEFQGRHATTLAQELLPGFMAFFKRMQAADGRLRPLPPWILGRAFLGLFVSYAITVAFFRDLAGLPISPDDLDQLGDILLHGILKEETAP
ncbi:MAG: TetR/AcrR family transcriptional regulator [Chloroflexota bacterium]